MIKGFIPSLLITDQSLVRHIVPTFKNLKTRLFETESFETLGRVLGDVVNNISRHTIYFDIDAIDELKQDSLTLFLLKLQQFLNAKFQRLKMAILP